MSKYQLHTGDCLAILPTLPDNSVDLILTDPPYYKVKGDAWDRQWATATEYLAWLDNVLAEFARVLRPNGSLYLFASSQMAARVECLVGTRFAVINRITWRKAEGRHKAACKTDLRSFFPASEAIIFAEHMGADNIAKGEVGYGAKCDELCGFIFEPLRSWMRAAMLAANLTPKDINRAVGSSLTGGGMASHYVGKTGQWELPTEKHYLAIQRLAPTHFTRTYADLRKEYEALHTLYETACLQYESLRRPFQVTADVPYTDVWDFPTVSHYRGKHPCEKPQDLLRHIIAASSRPDAVVLDAFMGSGSTGKAALALGRDFIGIELDQVWVAKVTTDLEKS